MKMLKLLVAMVLALSLCCVSASAVTVKSTSGVAYVGAVTAGDSDVELIISELDIPVKAAVAEIAEVLDSMEDTVAEEMAVMWVKDIHAEGVSEENPLTLNFSVPGSDGQLLLVMHYNGANWEVVGRGVGPEVAATFTSLSPVALVVAEPETPDDSSIGNGGNGNNGNAGSTGKDPNKSPQTGETNVIVAGFAASALVGFSALAVAKKRS